MVFPIGVAVMGLLGAAAGVRAAYRPFRALVRDGFVLKCAGVANCDPAMLIDSFRGKAEVYSPIAGTVVRISTNVLEIASKGEPVVVRFMGDPSKGGLDPHVQLGQRVTAGQVVGMASRVAFAASVVVRDAAGVKTVPLEPASWLAARGLRISAKRRAGQAQQWCEGGRKLAVPEAVGKCGIKLPAPSGFMVLPVNVTLG